MDKAVIIAIGDSLMAGDNARIVNSTRPNPRPFGSPAPRVHIYGRWNDPNAQVRLGNAGYSGPAWTPCVPDTLNWDYLGASPVYSLSSALARMYGIKNLYVIYFAVPGSDASRLHPVPAASWHPTVPNGLFQRFINYYLKPALATAELQTGGIPLIGIFGSFGQNSTNPVFDISACNDLAHDMETIVSRIDEEIGTGEANGFLPTVVMHRNPVDPSSVPPPFTAERTAIVRAQQELWRSRGDNSTQRRGLAWLDNVSIETGDTVHPSHDGQLDMGLRDFYAYASAGISLPIIP